MSEMLAGVGHQKSLLKIAKMTERELRKKRGVAKHLRLTAEGLVFEAERLDFDKEFTAFTLTLDASDERAEKLVAAAQKLGEACDAISDNGTLTINFSDAPAVDALSLELVLPEVWRFDGSKYRSDPLDLEMLFKAMLQYKASDIHLTPGRKPIFRVDNIAHASDVMPPLSAPQIRDLIQRIAPDQYWQEFQEHNQTSFGYHQMGLGFARVSAFIKSDAPHLTLRYLPETIPSFEEINMPAPMMEKLANLHSGLVLIVGMTGSGKTTTCAAILDWINQKRSCHILTIEDPVEYVYENKKAFISQRSLGQDVATFAEAVEGALRQDPDVILVGEMRDADTIRAAISAASTGHLVLSTLHANNAYSVINRVVSFFDPVERDLVRQQLVDSLRGVICQMLIPKKGGGRVPALEVMFNDIKSIGRAIVEGDTLGLRIGMQQSLSDSMLFEFFLHKMYEDGLIELQVAKDASPDLDMLDQMLMGTYSVPRMQS